MLFSKLSFKQTTYFYFCSYCVVHSVYSKDYNNRDTLNVLRKPRSSNYNDY